MSEPTPSSGGSKVGPEVSPAEASPDQPRFEVRVDPAAPAGDLVSALARLLRALTKREQEREKGPAAHSIGGAEK